MEADTDTSDQKEVNQGSSYYSNESSQGRNNVLLRVECISSKTLKRFLFLQFLLRWLAVGLWILFTVLAYRVSFYTSREQLNLRLATGLSAGFLGVVCIALGSLLHAVWKTFSSQQHWALQRRRLVAITLVQLAALAGAAAMTAASSAIASANHCNAIFNSCKWTYFIQWTCWNTVASSQLLLTHVACVWTDANAQPQRRLLAHLLPGMADKPKNTLILEAPWSIHLPKLLLWVIAEATIIVQLVISLRGHYYVEVPLGECANPVRPCLPERPAVSLAVCIIRAVVYGIYIIWHFVLVWQGSADMARMPMDTFRTGRMLIRMVCSRDLGIGSNLVPYTTLVVVAVTEYYVCVSCQQNYIFVGLIMQCSILMSMGSILVQPRSRSSDEDIMMQAWLQQFAWTEKKLQRRIERRNSLPADNILLWREPMFCFETAVKMLYWCGFVYEYGEDGDLGAAAEDSEELALRLYDLEHLELVTDPETSTKCLVAWGPHTCVVAFRGTANKQNARYDMKAWLVPHTAEEGGNMSCGLGAAAAVHSGFAASWQSGLKQAVCKLLREVATQQGSKPGGMHLLVTGHSLGGVMAVLAAYDMADLCPWRSLQVYTVGAPRPGNQAFAAKYEAKVPATWHIINPKDPVPRVGKLGVLYARPGQRVLVDQGGDMQVRPTPLDIRLSSANPVRQMLDEVTGLRQLMTLWADVKSHMLASYRTCFVNILKAELRQPRFEEGLEEVLELANSLSLTHLLKAADLDIKATGKGVPRAEAGLQAAQSFVTDSLSVV